MMKTTAYQLIIHRSIHRFVVNPLNELISSLSPRFNSIFLQVAFMGNQFTQITDAASLEQLLAHSHDAPVILFKHSSTCPISSAAYQQMSQVEAEVSLVVVQRARDVSNEIETRTGIPHASPQAIVLRNGQAVWNASHFDITASAVEQAVREHA
jgi:bacillithiol system protein YtxJ